MLGAGDTKTELLHFLRSLVEEKEKQLYMVGAVMKPQGALGTHSSGT